MMKKIFSAALWLLLLLVCLAGTTWAQDYVYAVGNPSFSVDIPIEDGYINVANGNIHLEIPISNVKQRGSLQHSSRLVYDSRIWKIIEDSSGNYSWQPNNVPNSMAGWRYVDGNDIGSVDYGAFQDTYISCGPNVTGYNTNGYGKFTYTDSSGTVHPFDSYIDSMVPSQCNNNTSETTSQLMTATDASGYNLIVTALNGYISTETVYDNSGNQVYPQLIDRNGNYASYDSHGNPINTSGIIPVTVSTAGNVTTYSVLIEGGQPIKYIVTTEPINVSTEFNESAVSENTSTITAIQSIQLPDGSMYSFTYDSGTSAGNYGELTSMTLPTGGKINIQYHPFIDSYQNNNRWIFTWQDEDGSKEFLQNVLSQCSSNSTDTGCQEQDLYRIVKSDTNVNDVVYTLTLNNGAWNTQTDIWNGASGYTGDTSGGKKVITILPQYNFSYPCPMSAGVPACNGSENVTQLSESVTLFDAPGGQLASLDKYTYDPSSGKPLQEQEWDYSSGAPSSIPIRQTNYVYASHVNNASLLTQKCSYFNGSLFSNTQYSYDQSSLLSSGATSQLESVGGPRGNLTSVSNQIFNYPGAAYSTSNACPLLSGAVATNSFIYDDAGMKRSMTDANGNTTIYNYACNDTFLKQTTYPNGQTVSITQDCFTGDPLSKTDRNGQITSYGYDGLGRKSSIKYPDGGFTSYSYQPNAQLPEYVTETKAISDTVSTTNTTIWDEYGRKSSTTTSDPSGNDTVSYTYNSGTSSKCVTNPQRTSPSSTDGTTCYSMDFLHRIINVTQPDGKQINVVYLGNQATVTDENGHQKQYTYDSFHDLTSVLEPNANGTPAWNTTYTYDGAGHVINVNQVGDSSSPALNRTFTYDSLGRMIQQSIPESGITNYGYDGDGNLTTKTDSRGITTSYTYDQLNRLTSKTYSGSDPAGTASSCYQYDQTSIPGASPGKAGNMLGRLSNEWTQEGACPASPPSSGVITRRSILAYDPMGRVLGEQQCTPANCTTGAPFNPAYSYDLAGDITSSTNGTGMISFSSTYDAAGHLSTLTSSWNDATHPPTLFSAPSYTPAGALTSATFGVGLNLNRSYDSRQRIINESDTGATQ